jgi:hypothetical protein
MGKHSARRRRSTALMSVVPVVLGSFAGVAALTGQASAAQTIVVRPATAHANGWDFVDDNGNGGTGQMVSGPAVAPLGNGSAELAVGASNQGYALATTGLDGSALSAITKLDYYTYQTGSGPQAIALQFDVDLGLEHDAYDGRLVFEPYQNGAVTVGSGWQEWSPLDGLWWASHQGATNGTNGKCPQSAPCSWDTFLDNDHFPGPTISAHDNPGAVLFKAGSGWTSFDGNVDDFTIGLGDQDITFDFEPETPCTMTCFVNASTGDDANGGDDTFAPKRTIQAAVDQVSSGGTVVVAPGTYDENVTINTPLTLRGNQSAQPVAGRTPAGSDESTVDGTITLKAAVNLDGMSVTNSVTTGAASGIVVKTGGSGSVIQNTIVDSIHTDDTGGNGTAQGIYLENGPDSVVIDGNAISNVTSTRSAKGIQIGDSAASDPSANVFIKNNDISNITSDTRGGYGVQVNTAAGAPILHIDNNTFHGLSGAWVHAVGLETDALNAVVHANDFSNLSATNADDNVAVWFEGEDTSFGTAAVTYNSLDVSPASGIKVDPALSGSSVDGTCNWWGATNGPSDAGPGSGAKVSSGVTFSPWNTASDLSTCNGTADAASVDTVTALPSPTNAVHTVTVGSHATDPIGLTDVYYNLFDTADNSFVCTLAHTKISGAPTEATDSTVLSAQTPFDGMQVLGGIACPAGGITDGTYLVTANWENTDGIYVGGSYPANTMLSNYPPGARSAPFVYDNTAPTLNPTVTPNPVALNGTATATPNSSDNLSGIDTESCDTPDTSVPGQYTVDCTATDNAGNTGTGSASYTVATALNHASTTCDGAYSGTGTDVVVPSGATCILVAGTHVLHDVNVKKGGTLVVQGASVDHNIKAGGAAGIAIEPGSTVGNDVTLDGTTGSADGGNRVCDSTIGHNLSVTKSTAGAGDWEIGCDYGNSIANDLHVDGNHNAVDVTYNSVGGNMTVTNNAVATVIGNDVTHDANCSKNAVQSGSGNTAGHKSTCPA